MSNTTEKSLDGMTGFDAVKFIREEIRFQHGLIGTRVTWLITLESLLLVAFTTSRNFQDHDASIDSQV